MIQILHATKDPYRIYGIKHFYQKYYAKTGYEKIDIKVLYGNISNMNTPHIKIAENFIENRVSGFIKVGNEKIPIFERPVKLNCLGEILAEFSNEIETYPCAVINKDNNILISMDIFNEIGRILSGHLEPIWKSKKYNYIKKIPIVDYYEKILFEFISRLNKENSNQCIKSFWPNNKKFVLCLTHDVDNTSKTHQYLTHLIKHLRRGNLSAALYQIKSLYDTFRGYEPYWNFKTILNIESMFNVKSTFFFLNENEKPYFLKPKSWILFGGRCRFSELKVREIINFIHKSGWEIGLHGSYNSYIHMDKLKSDKLELEGMIKEEIHGIRQHYLRLSIPYTWKLQEKTGFRYDSTLGFNDEIGFRSGTCFPFLIFDSKIKKQLPLLEIPLIIMDSAFILNKNSWQECKEIIDTVENLGGVLTVVWHTEVFNEREYPHWSEFYKNLIDECHKRNAWITNAGEIEKLWKSRI